MKIKLLLLLIPIVSLNTYAMQYVVQQYEKKQHRPISGFMRKTILIPSSQKMSQPIPSIPAAFCDILEQNIITISALCKNYSCLYDAAKTINALAQTNRFLNQFINDDDRTLKWIKELSEHFAFSNIHVAKVLYTGAAKDRFILQKSLETIYSCQGLDICKSKGADLDFTYTYDGHTLLQFDARLRHRDNFAVVQWFLENGADINRVATSDGCNAAMKAIRERVCGKEVLFLFFQHPALMIDYQDKNKNTLLHWCVYEYSFDSMFKAMKQLLERGANPTLINKDGSTPLDLAKAIKYGHFITLLKKATNDFNSKKKDEI